MSDDRSWLTADYPELRDGPPWVMEEMSCPSRGLPSAILAADPARDALAGRSAQPPAAASRSW